jgi:hypothetical protein
VNNNPADLKIGQTLSNNHIKRRDAERRFIARGFGTDGRGLCSCNQQAGQRSGGCCNI